MEKRTKNLANEELAAYCRGLSMLLQSGVSSEEAVAMLCDAKDEGATRAAVAIQAQFTGSLSEAVRAAGVFPAYMVGMVEAGETAGRLSVVLDGLSVYFERLSGAERRLKSAVLYPAVSLLVLSLLLLILAVQVLPIFEAVYIRLSGAVSAGVYIGAAYGLCWLAFGFAVMFTAFLAVLALLWRVRRPAAVAVMRRLPVFSVCLREMQRASFTSAYSIYVSGAVDALTAFDSAAALVSDTVLSAQLEACRRSLDMGESFARAAYDASLYPAIYTRMLLGGAMAGRDAEGADFLAEKLWESAAARLERAVGTAEPVLSVVLTALIGVLLISVMLPLIGIMNTVG